MAEKEILTIKEASKLMQLHPETLAALVRNKQFPGRKIGHQYRFHRQNVIDFIKSGEK